MKLRKYYNNIADIYTQKNQKFPTDKLDLFLSHVPSGRTILDVGCGPGIETNYMHERNHKATGLDESDEMIKIAKKCYTKVPFVQGNILDMDNEFVCDSVWCNAVLMHYNKSDRAVIIHKKIFRYAKNVAGFVVPLQTKKRENRAHKDILFNLFTEKKFRSEIINPEWDIIHSEHLKITTQWLFVICRKNVVINSGNGYKHH